MEIGYLAVAEILLRKRAALYRALERNDKFSNQILTSN